ncbi:GNAT family N-acetyltransferase [Amycolatopsis endophytica]|uniref:Putative acetyltransferase n=1 Tax=Amycolatopsis endophytica TaxID=860233 RepID=A0A853BBL6_9PSEU|nr:GNAT family N-acetyltransferase [Amycolatopsis endophytica]NYI92077.1 putative acetyltransferase [Amycolatopsis endophytica]
MSDYTVRTLRPDEHRAAADLFRATLHVAPTTDETWQLSDRMLQPGRTLGAFDTELVGTARSFDAELTVPGGARAGVAAVTGVGVRSDRTRRGILTELMRAQLADIASRGLPFAALRASEGVIYNRYGYGVATRSRSYEIDRRRATFRPDVPAGGQIELWPLDTALERLPELYAALPQARPGTMSRPPYWWPAWERHAREVSGPVVTAVHQGPQGPDGYVVYTVDRKHWNEPAVLEILSLHTAGGEAFDGLWRYLLSVDLVDTIRADERPVDEVPELLFTKIRAVRETGGGDELWLRLVDVPAALGAREYEGDPVVLEVVDPVVEGNSGRYRVSPAGMSRTGSAPDLRLGADALAMLYFGTWRPSQLASAGRIQPADPTATARADRLFATPAPAWCGTHF